MLTRAIPRKRDREELNFMPIVIGAKRESDFTDPIGMLGDCHRRIERFLNVLVRVAEQAHGEAMNEDHRGALETALRYFRVKDGSLPPEQAFAAMSLSRGVYQ
jgi:hypothetical protein